MKRINQVLTLLFLTCSLYAQTELERSVTASAGDEVQQGGISLCWTLGELVTETYQDGQLIVTSGFQQGKPFSTVSLTETLDYAFKIYPNPTNDFVHIEVDTWEKLEVILYNVEGKKVGATSIEPFSEKNSLSLEQLPAGNYFLSVVNDENQYQSFKIQKINQ